MDNKDHNVLIAVLFAFLLVIPAAYVGADTVSAQQERAVSLESPTDSFVVGQEITVSGTAQNVNSVSMYVRNGSEYQLVTVAQDTEIHVDTSETFLETDVTLSTPSGQIFTHPGTYELGIIATIDAQANNGQPRQTLTESEFTRGVTDSSTITIEPQTLEGEVTPYQNQVAAADSAVGVRGSAPGQESVVVAFVSSNGTATSSEQPIFDDGVLDEDRLSVNFDVFYPGEKYMCGSSRLAWMAWLEATSRATSESTTYQTELKSGPETHKRASKYCSSSIRPRSTHPVVTICW